MLRRVILGLLLALALAPSALADGDPASDVLVPPDIRVYMTNGATDLQLEQKVQSTAEQVSNAGRPIKVAIIGNKTDLGAIPQLWAKPQTYARWVPFMYRQKGRGIQRSTDAGQTWTKISDREPIGRLVNVRQGTAYWLANEGLLVSTDKGATWNLQGQPVEASIGPFFDPKNDKRMVVAGAKGIFQTSDGGESWKLVSRLPAGFENLPKAGWFTNVAWDPVHDAFYVSHMGKPTYRLAGAR